MNVYYYLTVFINSIIGFISRWWLVVAYYYITNTGKGPDYYNPEGEPFRVWGGIMFLFYIAALLPVFLFGKSRSHCSTLFFLISNSAAFTIGFVLSYLIY